MTAGGIALAVWAEIGPSLGDAAYTEWAFITSQSEPVRRIRRPSCLARAMRDLDRALYKYPQSCLGSLQATPVTIPAERALPTEERPVELRQGGVAARTNQVQVPGHQGKVLRSDLVIRRLHRLRRLF
jgi:hypothetical protein